MMHYHHSYCTRQFSLIVNYLLLPPSARFWGFIAFRCAIYLAWWGVFICEQELLIRSSKISLYVCKKSQAGV